MELTDFLLARIAEDEKIARAAYGHRVNAASGDPDHWELGQGMPSEVIGPMESVAGAKNAAAALHIARHDPARVLAECDAKRRALALLDEVNERGIPRLTIYTRDLIPRLLALPYADHPDFRQEWRP